MSVGAVGVWLRPGEHGWGMGCMGGCQGMSVGAVGAWLRPGEHRWETGHVGNGLGCVAQA